MFVEFGRALWFGFIFCSGIFVAYAAQDVVPNPRAWFWSLLWVFGFHAIAVTFYLRRVPHWSRWAAACIAVAALVSFSIMFWRVWI